MIRPTPWFTLALAGQSNGDGTNNNSMVGVPMPVVRASFPQGDLRWWATSGSTAPRVCPAAGVAEALTASRRGLRLCKDTVGGSSISTWISTYGPRHIAAMQARGWAFDGMIWAQGENECRYEDQALAYGASLESLFALYWSAFPALKVCIIKVSSSFVGLSIGVVPDYIPEVRAGQDAFGAAHPDRVAVIEGLIAGTQWDGVHGTGPQNRVLGANALTALEAL